MESTAKTVQELPQHLLPSEQLLTLIQDAVDIITASQKLSTDEIPCIEDDQIAQAKKLLEGFLSGYKIKVQPVIVRVRAFPKITPGGDREWRLP